MKCRKCNHVYDDSLSACPLCGEPAPPAEDTQNPDTGAAQSDRARQSENSYGGSYGGETGSAYSSADQKGTRSGSYSGYQGAAAYPPANGAEPVAENAGVTPLVLGILGLLIPFVGIVLGIIAIVMGNNQRKAFRPGTAHYGFGQAGWVLGIISVVIQALLIIYFITVFSLLFSFIQDALRHSGLNGYGSYAYPYFDF